MDWQAIGVSLRLAGATTAILLVAGIPLAYWLATSRWRGKFLVEALVTLPVVMPPTVVGFYLLVALSPDSWAGRAFSAVFGGTLPFSFAGLLVGSVFFSLPFAVQPFATAFAQIDRALLEASWCLGVSGPRTFARVALPLAANGIVAGAVLGFAHTLGEFGVVLMIGGNLPGVTRTISIAIYDDVQALDYASAGRTSLVLLILSFLVVAATHALKGRAFRRRRFRWS